jgi:hypothetical protein
MVTRTDMGQVDINKFNQDYQKTQAKKSPKQLCNESGGIWDDKTMTCLRFQTQTAQTPNSKTSTAPTKVTNTNPNNHIITDANGNQRIQTPQDVANDKNQIAKINANNGSLGGAEALQIQQEQQRIQARNAQLMQMAQQGLLSQAELQNIPGADINWGQAIGAGVVGAIPSALSSKSLSSIAIGAAAGSVIPGVGTIAGALIGAGLSGFLTSTKNSIKQQQTGSFTADQTSLIKGQQYLRVLISDTNKNPQNAPENIELFYKTLSLIDAAHAKTKKDSMESLNKWLGEDGLVQLQKFETFDGMRSYYINHLQMALMKPDPNISLVTAEDLGVANE